MRQPHAAGTSGNRVGSPDGLPVHFPGPKGAPRHDRVNGRRRRQAFLNRSRAPHAQAHHSPSPSSIARTGLSPACPGVTIGASALPPSATRERQGRGLGGAVLRDLLDRRDDPRPVRLLAVRGSAALRLYARNGFLRERHHENGIDVVLAWPPDSSPRLPARHHDELPSD